MAVQERVRPEVKRFDAPDETRHFEKGKLAVIHVGGDTVGMATYEPGFRVTECFKLTTEWCEVAHAGYVLSGRMRIRMADGTEFDVRAGDYFSYPGGHDAWVVGDEPVIALQVQGADRLARPGD